MHSSPVFVLGIAVCFLSPYLASLPQPFRECLPFGLFPVPFSSFRHFCFRFWLLGSLFLPFRSSCFRLTVAFTMLRFRLRFLVFPICSWLVSHSGLPGSRTRLSVCFLSFYPASLPQPFYRRSPFSVFRLPLGADPYFRILSSASG